MNTDYFRITEVHRQRADNMNTRETFHAFRRQYRAAKRLKMTGPDGEVNVLCLRLAVDGLRHFAGNWETFEPCRESSQFERKGRVWSPIVWQACTRFCRRTNRETRPQVGAVVETYRLGIITAELVEKPGRTWLVIFQDGEEVSRLGFANTAEARQRAQTIIQDIGA